MVHRVRGYASSEDYDRIRRFFQSLHETGPRPGGDWHVCHFDYWYWHWLRNVVERDPAETRIWEDEAGRIVAVLNQGDPGVCHLHVHPDARSRELDGAMMIEAESHMSAETRDGRRVLWIWSDEADEERNALLEGRGYRTYASAHAIEHHGHLALGEPIRAVPLPAGYALRPMAGDEDLPARSLASWRSFHPDEPDDGCDLTGGWYRNVQRSPTYRCDLDIVAVATDGEIASFATCYYDESSRSGVFVLDGTAAAHQRRGLGKAVMTEALRHLRAIGGTDAYVSWYELPAGALYESVGLKEAARSRAWRKEWPVEAA
jgi:mycothiol synthase